MKRLAVVMAALVASSFAFATSPSYAQAGYQACANNVFSVQISPSVFPDGTHINGQWADWGLFFLDLSVDDNMMQGPWQLNPAIIRFTQGPVCGASVTIADRRDTAQNFTLTAFDKYGNQVGWPASFKDNGPPTKTFTLTVKSFSGFANIDHVTLQAQPDGAKVLLSVAYRK